MSKARELVNAIMAVMNEDNDDCEITHEMVKLAREILNEPDPDIASTVREIRGYAESMNIDQEFVFMHRDVFNSWADALESAQPRPVDRSELGRIAYESARTLIPDVTVPWESLWQIYKDAAIRGAEAVVVAYTKSLQEEPTR